MGNHCCTSGGVAILNKSRYSANQGKHGYSLRSDGYTVEELSGHSNIFTPKVHSSEYGKDRLTPHSPPPVPEKRNPNAIRFAFQDLESAKQESKRTGKPIFCRRTGKAFDESKQPNSTIHPLIVEAAESLFIPVSLESDLDVPKVCASVAILDKKGEKLLPEIYGEQLAESHISILVDMMVASLIKMKCKPPKYLCLLDEEMSGRTKVLPNGKTIKLERLAVFGVSNIHQAEADIAGFIGALDIQAGLYNGRQVLKIKYSSSTTSFQTLMREVIKKNLVTTIYYQSNDELILARQVNNESVSTHRLNKLQDLKIEKIENVDSMNKIIDGRSGLRKTGLRYVPMTSLQKIRTNRLVFQGYFNKAAHLLSPRQAEIMMKSFSNVKTRIDAVDLPLKEAWK